MHNLTVRGVTYEWDPWISLGPALALPLLSSEPGLYRIRRAGHAELDYIGQTGIGIRRRVRMLRGITGTVMPYRDPHTAAPALWALLQSEACEFEVSGLPIEGDTAWRRGLEAVAIALHRQKFGHSPTANFGRMPTGYRMSSGNNARLVAAGTRFRGGVASELDRSHAPGIRPVDGLEGNPQSETWCGHQWSSWQPLAAYRLALGRGIYRIRGGGAAGGLIYIGEGDLLARLGSHLRKARPGGRSLRRQERVFSEAGEAEFGYVLGEWEAHERLELETDLIAAHVLVLGHAPPGQFIG